MRSAVWTVRSVDEAFFASDPIIGIKKEKNKQKQHKRDVKTTQNNAVLLTFYADYVMISKEMSKNQMP